MTASPRARLLAVDYGDRRVGLAISDPEGIIATPAGFIARRAGKRPPVAEILRRAEELGARGFVLGLPLDENGEETPRCAEVRGERYTTAAALRTVRELGGSTRGRKGDVDALAATLLLQHALDRTG